MNLPGEIEEFLSRYLGYEGFRFHLRRYLLVATVVALILVGYISSVAHHSANLTARYGYNPDAPQTTPQIAEDASRTGVSPEKGGTGKFEGNGIGAGESFKNEDSGEEETAESGAEDAAETRGKGKIEGEAKAGAEGETEGGGETGGKEESEGGGEGEGTGKTEGVGESEIGKGNARTRTEERKAEGEESGSEGATAGAETGEGVEGASSAGVERFISREGEGGSRSDGQGHARSRTEEREAGGEEAGREGEAAEAGTEAVAGAEPGAAAVTLAPPTAETAAGGGAARTKTSVEQCGVEEGAWERDSSYPLYSACPFVEPRFACKGRPSSDSAGYRWRPKECQLPRLDAKKLLGNFRDKQIVFAGDAVAKQMFLSLLCLVWAQSSPPNSGPSSSSSPLHQVTLKSASSKAQAHATAAEEEAISTAGAAIWRFSKGNVTFVFFPSNYLVTTNSSSTSTSSRSSGSEGASVLQVFPHKMGPWHKYAERYADLLVMHAAAAFSDNRFLPALASATPQRSSSGSGSSSGDGSSSSSSKERWESVVFLNGSSPKGKRRKSIVPYPDSLSAFRTALTTVNTWAKSTPRLKNIPVFFLGTPGHHFASSKAPSSSPRYKNIWKAKWSGKGACDSVNVPLAKPHRDKERQKTIDSMLETGNSSSSSSCAKNGVRESLGCRGVKDDVHILPIGHISAARADAHVSKWHDQSISGSRQDCMNFCLPGVPDVWNELLLTLLPL